MKIDFTNRVAVITGAAGNLGAAVAQAYFEAGAKLALVDRSEDRLPDIFPQLADSSDHLFIPGTDVTDQESVSKAIGEIVGKFGRIDILVNTAGGYRAGTALHETPIKDWDFMLDLNARSVFITCRETIPHMLKNGYGKIVNISSRAALAGDANHSAYSVSKTAVLRLTESMAAELKDRGINVNCILPGLIDTPANRSAMPDADYAKWVKPESLAGIILFLTSDSAGAINGAAIPAFGRS